MFRRKSATIIQHLFCADSSYFKRISMGQNQRLLQHPAPDRHRLLAGQHAAAFWHGTAGLRMVPCPQTAHRRVISSPAGAVLSKCSHFALTSPQCRHCRPEASCNISVHLSMCSRKLSGSTFFISSVRHFRNAAIIPGNHSLFCHSFLSFSDALSIVFSYKFYFYCSKVP